MSSTTCSEPLIPTLDSLGDDLLATTPLQRRLALARPFLGVVAYGLASYAHLWWLTPLLVFLIFVAVVTVTHDVVHGSLGLSRRQTEWALFATGAVLLESGHAYRATHLRHLTQTHTLRGRIIPSLFLELTYHLEHHLYPEVPSHNLPKLSRRLDGTLRRAGVRPWRVP